MVGPAGRTAIRSSPLPVTSSISPQAASAHGDRHRWPVRTMTSACTAPRQTVAGTVNRALRPPTEDNLDGRL